MSLCNLVCEPSEMQMSGRKLEEGQTAYNQNLNYQKKMEIKALFTVCNCKILVNEKQALDSSVAFTKELEPTNRHPVFYKLR